MLHGLICVGKDTAEAARQGIAFLLGSPVDPNLSMVHCLIVLGLLGVTILYGKKGKDGSMTLGITKNPDARLPVVPAEHVAYKAAVLAYLQSEAR